MTTYTKFEGKVTNGKLPKSTSDAIIKALGRMEGLTVEILLKRKVKCRSNPMNRFYWGVVVEQITAMFREGGNDVDAEDVHEFLKTHVGKLRRAMVLPDGEVKQIPGTTTRLTTMEFMDYIEKIRCWSAEMGLMLPLPNEQPHHFNPTEGAYAYDHAH